MYFLRINKKQHKTKCKTYKQHIIQPHIKHLQTPRKQHKHNTKTQETQKHTNKRKTIKNAKTTQKNNPTTINQQKTPRKQSQKHRHFCRVSKPVKNVAKTQVKTLVQT